MRIRIGHLAYAFPHCLLLTVDPVSQWLAANPAISQSCSSKSSNILDLFMNTCRHDANLPVKGANWLDSSNSSWFLLLLLLKTSNDRAQHLKGTSNLVLVNKLCFVRILDEMIGLSQLLPLLLYLQKLFRGPGNCRSVIHVYCMVDPMPILSDLLVDHLLQGQHECSHDYTWAWISLGKSLFYTQWFWMHSCFENHPALHRSPLFKQQRMPSSTLLWQYLLEDLLHDWDIYCVECVLEVHGDAMMFGVQLMSYYSSHKLRTHGSWHSTCDIFWKKLLCPFKDPTTSYPRWWPRSPKGRENGYRSKLWCWKHPPLLLWYVDQLAIITWCGNSLKDFPSRHCLPNKFRSSARRWNHGQFLWCPSICSCTTWDGSKAFTERFDGRSSFCQPHILNVILQDIYDPSYFWFFLFFFPFLSVPQAFPMIMKRLCRLTFCGCDAILCVDGWCKFRSFFVDPARLGLEVVSHVMPPPNWWHSLS